MAGLRLIVPATSSKPIPNTSCSRKAARSSGDNRSSASISGSVTSSSSVSSTTGSGNHSPDVDLALLPRRLELVEAQPRHGAAQEGFRFAHSFAVGAHPADERLLHHVLCVGDRAEHAVGDAREAGTQRLERRRRRPDAPDGWPRSLGRLGRSLFLEYAKADREAIPAVDDVDHQRELDLLLRGELGLERLIGGLVGVPL